MAKRPVAVYLIPGLDRSARRALAYLVFEGDERVNAWSAIRRLDGAAYRSIQVELNAVTARFRHWIKGLKRPEYHHGWENDPDFSMGYVFRWDHQRQHRRLYGFLASPRPSLEVCILCCYDSKHAWATDTAIKKIVRLMSEHADVKRAVQQTFGREGQSSWTIH